jgi:hypothetical protein
MKPLENAAQHRSGREASAYRSNKALPDASPRPGESEPASRAERDRLDALLDEGLKGTFPASDPVAVSPRGRL